MQRTVLIGSIVGFVAAAISTALALSAALPARGAAIPSENPAVFVTRTVALVVSDDYESVWPSLYPRHQEVAPRDEYVACELQTPVGWTLRSAKALRVVQRARLIPGETTPKRVTLVTLRLVIANRALHTVGGFTHTFTAVADGARWTWILTPARYRLYRDDACGDSTAGMPAHP